MQYKTLFPVIAEPCTCCGPCVDPNIGEPYPIEAAGNFCLKDAFFPSCPGDSLIFHDNGSPTSQCRGSTSPPTGRKPQGPAAAQRCTKESTQKPPPKEEESSKPISKTAGTSSPQIPDSTSSSKTSLKSKHSPTAKEQRDKRDHEKHLPLAKKQKDKHDHEDHNAPTKPRDQAHKKDNK